MAKGYSLRDLSEKTGINISNLSVLERGNRSPHGKTVRALAEALEVKVTDLYEIEQLDQVTPLVQNTNETQTSIIKPARSGRTRAKKQPAPPPAPVISWYIFEKGQEESEPLRMDNQDAAERIKALLGQARVYQAVNRAEASDKHTDFLREVARGHEVW